MKRHSLYVRTVIISIAVLTFFTFGCKSSGFTVEQVDPLLLLDDNSSFYLRIPSQVDESIITRVLKSNINGIDDGTAFKIADRIDVIYAGLIRKKHSTEFQLASSCNFPSIAVNKVFTKKNNWIESKINLKNDYGNDCSYSVYNNEGIDISFPNESIAFAGRNVPQMVSKYHVYSNKMSEDEIENELSKEKYDWLKYDSENSPDAIRFFASTPQSFLTMLTGANLNFKLIYVRGQMRNDPKNDSQFIMDLEFEFKDYRMLPAARGVLAVAFGLTDSNIILETPTHLKISNIKIVKEQLMKLFVL